MTRRLIILALAFVALACGSTKTPEEADRERAAAANVALPAAYSTQNGDKPVGVIPDALLRDAARGKDLDMTIEYPIAAGTYPLIVWSHGFGGSSRAYVGLSSYWASHGFVVIKPTHADAGKLQAAAQDAEAIWASQTPADWRNRVDDVRFVIDAIPQLEEKYPELKGKIDAKNVGVGGHSYGAFTAMLAAGAKTFPGGTTYADPRVKAVLVMSPQGPSEQRGLTNESFATVAAPALFMTGTHDVGVTDAETPEWRRQAFELSPAGDKWLVVLKNARHSTFAGRVGGMVDTGNYGSDITAPDYDPTVADPRLRGGYVPPGRVQRGANRDPQLTERAIFTRAKVIAVAFWDAYLQGNAKGKDFLGKLDANMNIEVVKK